MKSLDSFPWVSLGVFPTPIQKLENTSKLLHTNVYVKRDDLTGLGLGGNKTRKLEFLLADAKNRGAAIVFTTGGASVGDYDFAASTA
jgi:1-aminocyclopropane-1-carboxylate deaminase/D-cysteine desulfhydrase-like pyridoxal-dependent ACC family enzyme